VEGDRRCRALDGDFLQGAGCALQGLPAGGAGDDEFGEEETLARVLAVDAELEGVAGASSTSFWWRRWREQSRVETTTTLPWESARHWVSTCRGLSR